VEHKKKLLPVWFCQLPYRLTETLHFQALVDSGAEQNLINPSVVNQFSIPLEPLVSPLTATALDRKGLTSITQETRPVPLIVSGNHCETIEFLLFPLVNIPMILGFHDWRYTILTYTGLITALRVGASFVCQTV